MVLVLVVSSVLHLDVSSRTVRQPAAYWLLRLGSQAPVLQPNRSLAISLLDVVSILHWLLSDIISPLLCAYHWSPPMRIPSQFEVIMDFVVVVVVV